MPSSQNSCARFSRDAVSILFTARLTGLPRRQQHAGQVAIGARDFGASIDQEDDMGGAPDGHLGLAEDLGWDILVIFHHDAARIDQFEAAAVVLGGPVDAVARDPRLVADDGAALPRDPVEQGGFSDVGPAHNHHRGDGIAACLL